MIFMTMIFMWFFFSVFVVENVIKRSKEAYIDRS